MYIRFKVQYKYNLHCYIQSWSLGKGVNLHELSVFVKFALSLFHQSFKQNLIHHFCKMVFSRLCRVREKLALTYIKVLCKEFLWFKDKYGITLAAGATQWLPAFPAGCVCACCIAHAQRDWDATCMFLPLLLTPIDLHLQWNIMLAPLSSQSQSKKQIFSHNLHTLLT